MLTMQGRIAACMPPAVGHFRLAAWLVALAAVFAAGCSRPYWRKQADDLSYAILEEKRTIDPRWQPPRIEVQPDERSRFFDPYDPDNPPLPPDDPAAGRYMDWVYNMRGWRGWKKLPRTVTVESPDWLEPFGYDSGVVNANYSRSATLPEIRKLTLEEAIELSYIHSRDYQIQLEGLYLGSLALTFERFRFDVQFVGLGGRRPSSDVFNTITPGALNAWSWQPRAGVSKLLPTGGQMLVELANQTVWLFGNGPNQNATASVLSFQVLQPLLVNGGRRVALENLTQNERNVLYQLRNFVRFRQNFFSTVVAGSSAGNVAAVVGGGVPFLGGAAAIAGAVGGGVTGVPLGVGGAPGGLTAAALAGGGGAGIIAPGGFLGLLQQSQVIANQDYNIFELQQQLERLRARAGQPSLEFSESLEALPPGVVIPPRYVDRLSFDAENQRLVLKGALTEKDADELRNLSNDRDWNRALRDLWLQSSSTATTLAVAQLESQLANGLSAQVNNRRQLEDLLDQYKLVLGLPTDLKLDVELDLLRQFQFIDPKVTALRQEITDVLLAWEEIDALNPKLEEVRMMAATLLKLRDDLYRDGMEAAENDALRVREYLPRRLELAEDDAIRERIRSNNDRDRRLLLSLRFSLEDIDSGFAELLPRLKEDELPLEELRTINTQLRIIQEKLVKVAQGLTVVQINYRSELLQLNPFDSSIEEVVEIALEHRPDLMNSRAQVMDARRRVEVAANALQAVINLVAQGDIRTPSIGAGNDDPFSFRADQSTFRFGAQITAPIQIVQERNTYRAALIGYQQARRAYMFAEDQTKQSVRVAWRQLDAQRQAFEIGRQALRFSALQLDQAIEQTTAPVIGAAPANLGLNLIQALQSVLIAQNNLIQIWINYETNRLNIFRDMGIMEIDPSGFWLDEFYQNRAMEWRNRGGIYNRVLSDPGSVNPPNPTYPSSPNERFPYTSAAERSPSNTLGESAKRRPSSKPGRARLAGGTEIPLPPDDEGEKAIPAVDE
jgi:outer membrane protein TolC